MREITITLDTLEAIETLTALNRQVVEQYGKARTLIARGADLRLPELEIAEATARICDRVAARVTEALYGEAETPGTSWPALVAAGAPEGELRALAGDR